MHDDADCDTTDKDPTHLNARLGGHCFMHLQSQGVLDCGCGCDPKVPITNDVEGKSFVRAINPTAGNSQNKNEFVGPKQHVSHSPQDIAGVLLWRTVVKTDKHIWKDKTIEATAANGTV